MLLVAFFYAFKFRVSIISLLIFLIIIKKYIKYQIKYLFLPLILIYIYDMKKKKLLYVLLTFCLAIAASYAQQQGSISGRKISGKVTDVKGEAIPGAVVQVKGTALGTATDVNGNYELTGVAQGAALVFSLVGMESVTVETGNQGIVNVTLKELTTKLGEVVVVAFGTQQKYTMTSSVTQVDNSIMKNRPVTDPAAGLQGHVAGVNITQSSGAPGSISSILIRGKGSISSGTDPLIVVDGVPVNGGSILMVLGSSTSSQSNFTTTNALSYIDPNDIESISVLKDAGASALYGARGANGVILVTTKRAKTGKVSVSYSGYVGWQKPTELFQEANAYNYATAYNFAKEYDFITPTNTNFSDFSSKAPFTAEQIEAWKTGKVPSSPWRKRFFSGNNGFTQSHYLEASGGISKDGVMLKNNLSFAYFSQNGNVVNTSFDRYTLRDNSELSWGKFNAGLSVGLMANNTNQPNSKDIGQLYWMMGLINRQLPTDLIESDGHFNPTLTSDSRNPIAEALLGGYFKQKTYNALLNLNMSYSILDNLKLKFTGGLNYTGNYQNTFLNSITWNYPPTGQNFNNGTNSASKFNSQEFHYMGQLDLSYNTSFGKNNLSWIIGGQEELCQYNDGYMSAANFLNNSSNSMKLADPTTYNIDSNQWEWGLIGVFGRINYDYDKKYLLELNAREDGSSQLSPNHRWNFFPSVSAGWRLSQENFWSSLTSILPEFKLRASYGVLGNDQIPPINNVLLTKYYRDASIIGNAANNLNAGLNWVFDGTMYTPMALTQNPNNVCTWERTAVTDIAVDGTLLSPAFSYTVDYFNKKTNGMLMTEVVSNVNGGGNYIANVGSMKNSGIELTLNYSHTTANGLKYNLSGNYTHMTSKILDLGGQGITQVGNQVGYVISPFYLYVNDGLLTKDEYVNQKPNNPRNPLVAGQKWGDQRILDVTGDGKITALDKTVINKNGIPKNLFGFNFDVSYKGIGIAGMIQGAADFYKYLGGSVGYGFNQGYSITQWAIDNSYNPLVNENNYNTRLPRVSVSNTVNNAYGSTLFLFNSSYARLKNLQIYYELPKAITDNIRIKYVRIYVSGQNVYTVSSIPKALGIDPEAGSYGGYPLLRTFTAGLNVTF